MRGRNSAWGDYDNDGHIDMFVARVGNAFKDALYRNDGTGGFDRILTNAVVNDSAASFGGAWGDYNNDGKLDLFVTGGGTLDATTNGNNLLYRNDGNGAFSKITTGAIVNDGGPSEGCAWGDNGNGSGYGTVFKITTNGVLTTLAWFNGANGAAPNALAVGRDGNLYGTTANGGPGDGGTILRLVISEFTSVGRQPNGSVLLTGTGPANGSYRLWGSPDLSLPFASWTLLTSGSFDSSGNFSYSDAGASTNTSRFYQLSVP